MANSTATGTVYYYPFQPQTSNAVASGNTYSYNVTSSGWGSVNQAGNVFQNGQYNTSVRGF